MNPDLLREWRRWVRAEDEAREEVADAAFRAVFQALPRIPAEPGFADRVMRGVQLASERRARRARAAVVSAVAASAVTGVLLLVAAVAFFPRLLLRSVDLAVEATLWIVSAVDRGLDIWAILAQFGRAMAAIVAAPEVTLALVAVGLVGVGALYGLHKVFGLEQESSR